MSTDRPDTDYLDRHDQRELRQLLVWQLDMLATILAKRFAVTNTPDDYILVEGPK